MRRTFGAHHGDTRSAAGGESDGHGDAGTIGPGFVCQCEGRARTTLEKVGRYKNFDSVFFRVGIRIYTFEAGK